MFATLLHYSRVFKEIGSAKLRAMSAFRLPRLTPDLLRCDRMAGIHREKKS
jgi:hypothetical protein